MTRTRVALLVLTPVLLVGLALCTNQGRNLAWAVYTKVRGRFTVEERLEQYGDRADARLAPHFSAADVSYPPPVLVLVGLKRERLLEVYAGRTRETLHFIRAYPVLAASGTLGPKLREGDRQVPEGVYEIESLNPNSRFHLSLRLGYPNAFDRKQADAEQRKNLGDDIMIHGGAQSVGCLAIGDDAIEELFVLVARVGTANTRLILCPCDFRENAPPADPDAPWWVAGLYHRLESELRSLPKGTERSFQNTLRSQ